MVKIRGARCHQRCPCNFPTLDSPLSALLSAFEKLTNLVPLYIAVLSARFHPRMVPFLLFLRWGRA